MYSSVHVCSKNSDYGKYQTCLLCLRIASVGRAITLAGHEARPASQAGKNDQTYFLSEHLNT